MFNKLFFVLYSALILCFSPLQSLADESNPTWETIIAGIKDPFSDRIWVPEKRVFGTYKERQAALNSLKTQNLSSPAITKAQNAVNKANADYTKWAAGEGRGLPETYYPKGKNFRKNLRNKLIDAIQAKRRIVIDEINSDSLIRETNNKAKKAEDARLAKIAAAKKIEDARLAKIAAAAKKIEDERLAKIAAAKKIEDERLAKIAAAKKIEDARLAKIAADKVIEDARLAKIAAAEKKAEEERLAEIAAAEKKAKEERLAEIAAKKIEELQLASIATAKLRREEENAAFAARRAKKRAENYKIAQEIAADKARRLREYEKNKAINVASIALSLQDELNKGPKNPNIIKSITKDGIVRTIYCNPGPCTQGSVILHGKISGMDMGLPVNAVAKRLKENLAYKKPEATINIIEDLEHIDLLTTFNDVEIMYESEAEKDDTNDTNLTRALSIPIEQVTKNKEAHTKLIESSHDNVNPLQLSCWWC